MWSRNESFVRRRIGRRRRKEEEDWTSADTSLSGESEFAGIKNRGN